jgi:glycosyltransferase involved in cell wall biosynthesis
MNSQYDKIFLTNLPSFYKIKLFNEINNKIKIFVIFTDENEKTRNNDFYNGQIDFDYIILNGCDREKTKAICQIIKKTSYNQLVIDGWDTKLYWTAAFCSKKSKNACIIESSIYESQTKGIKGFIKKIFLSRISKAYPSGLPHKALLEALSFRGEIHIQGGVGLINLQPQSKYTQRSEVKNFLFVGRLVGEKNLPLLISAFNELSDLTLNIIGFGELETELKNLVKSDNIHFLGAVDNKKLPSFYQQNDVFVLPSKSETWGIVIDEALNNGMPVIVSSHVGCKEDLVTDKTGIVFESNNKESLKNAILKITQIEYYNSLRLSISKMDWQARQSQQVNVFCK